MIPSILEILIAYATGSRVILYYFSCSVNIRTTLDITNVHLMEFIHSVIVLDMETPNVHNPPHTSTVAQIKQKWSSNFRHVQMYQDPKVQVGYSLLSIKM